MILTRSKHYFTLTLPNAFVTRVDYTLTIGTGSVFAPTELKVIELNKPVPIRDTSIFQKSWIDISAMIRDYIEVAPIDFTGIAANEIQASGAQECLVATCRAVYIDTVGSSASPTLQRFIAADGYSKYEDNANAEPSKKILLTHDFYFADNRGYFIVPLRCESGDVAPTVDGVTVSLTYSEDNTRYLQYLVIPVGNYTSDITVVFEGETITISPVTECKYPLTQIQFVNRFGAKEVFHFYKASVKTITTKGETFKNGYYDGSPYVITKHQNQKLNVYGNEKINIETGFLNENYNDTIQELMLSEKVWLNSKPVNVDSSSLKLKTRVVERLISYSVDFEYAYDSINTV